MVMASPLPSVKSKDQFLKNIFRELCNDSNVDVFKSKCDHFDDALHPNRLSIKELSNWQLHSTLAPTDNGVCVVLNGDPGNVLEKKKMEKSGLFQVLNSTGAFDRTWVNNAKGSGIANAYEAVLAGPAIMSLREAPTENKSFKTSFNKASDFMSNTNSPFSVSVKLGMIAILTVTPSQTIASSGYKHLPIEARHCRFPDELPDFFSESKSGFFSVYSRQICLYVCQMRNVIARCVPWFVPTIDPTTRICDGYEAYWYLHDLNKIDLHHESCRQCLPDCETLTFSTDIEEKKIADYACSPNETHSTTTGFEARVDEQVCGDYPKGWFPLDILYDIRCMTYVVYAMYKFVDCIRLIYTRHMTYNVYPQSTNLYTA